MSLSSVDGIRIEQQVETVGELDSGGEAKNRFGIFGLAWPNKAKGEYPKFNHASNGHTNGSPLLNGQGDKEHKNHSPKNHSPRNNSGKNSPSRRSHSLFHKEKDDEYDYHDDVRPDILDPLYYTLESTHMESKAFLDKHKPLQFQLFDVKDGSLVLTIRRSPKLINEHIEVFDANSHLIGTVRKHFSVLSAQLVVLDEKENELFWLRGPKYPGWHKMGIFKGKDKVGFINKKWQLAGQSEEAESFDLLFPENADLSSRELLLAAAFLIDLIWFD